MTGFIDGIDSCNDLPIIAVEDITLEIGNKLVAEKINQARIELALIKYLPVSQRPFHTDVEYDYTWAYAASRASLASVPSYDTSYPLPFPLQASPGFIYPIIKDIVHPCIRDMSFLKRSRSRLMVNVGRDTTSAIHPIVIEESPKAAAHSLVTFSGTFESMTLELKEEPQDVKDDTHGNLTAFPFHYIHSEYRMIRFTDEGVTIRGSNTDLFMQYNNTDRLYFSRDQSYNGCIGESGRKYKYFNPARHTTFTNISVEVDDILLPMLSKPTCTQTVTENPEIGGNNERMLKRLLARRVDLTSGKGQGPRLPPQSAVNDIGPDFHPHAMSLTSLGWEISLNTDDVNCVTVRMRKLADDIAK
ncbi:hypothetical protein M422DRAFT_45268 [Sphaerobolus stellatus SS14]|nr:hypothetical protein M422DRAFT_45268 [Sphaerobolus stellatus SS14]